MKEKSFDLDDRLIDFASIIINISESLPKTMAGNYLAGQLLRSGSAPALLYGEAHAAESQNDFIHKMKLTLKELRETFNCLRIINKREWKSSDCECAISEVNQLISIFVKSIKTAQKNIIQKKNTGSGKETPI